MRVVILGEGPDELGPVWQRRRPLYPVHDNLGSLEIVVKRLCWLLLRQQIEIVQFTRPRGGFKQCDVLCNPQLLRQALQVCYPQWCRSEQLPPVEAAIIVWDASPPEQAQPKANAVSHVQLNFPGSLVHAALDSMLECALSEKAAMERATGLSHCSIGTNVTEVVCASADPKATFKQVLRQAGYNHRIDAGTKADIAGQLSVDFLRTAAALRELRNGLSALA